MRSSASRCTWTRAAKSNRAPRWREGSHCLCFIKLFNNGPRWERFDSSPSDFRAPRWRLAYLISPLGVLKTMGSLI